MIYAEPEAPLPTSLFSLEQANSAGQVKYWLILLTMLTSVLYYPVLHSMISDWWDDPDYSYAFLVPVLVGYVLWRERRRYAGVNLQPHGVGVLIMLLSVCALIGGTLGADLFIPRFSLWMLLIGGVIYLFGWSMLRALAFPLGYLVLMIPLPGIVQNQITFPLQLLASRTAENLIQLTGIPVFREGNLLRVPFYSVEVAQACSGIRSLLALIALGVAYAYLGERRTWIRLLLVMLMVPIAICTNAVRITVSCLVGYKFGPEWAEGFLHLFSGWLIFVAALILLFLVHALLGRIATYSSRKVHA
jgi:exosortase